MYYLALVHADDDSIGFTVPDVPGFTADVETTDMDAAIAEATRVLSAHLEEVKAAGGAVAPARSIAQLRADQECADDLAEASAVVFLPVLTALGRTVRVNLSLDEATLALIDREAKDRGITRSAMVQAAARAMAESRAQPRKVNPFDML